jgi:hypothetical protein
MGLLSPREEHGPWVSENRVLRGLLGGQREDVTGGQGSFMVVLFAGRSQGDQMCGRHKKCMHHFRQEVCK